MYERAMIAAGFLLLTACGSQQFSGSTPTPSSPSASEVRVIRSQSNAAIAARDLDALSASMLPDMVVTGGNGGILVGRDSVRAAFAREFADSAFLGYVREPERIEVSSVRPLVAEHGRWTGRWRRADGVQIVGGSYLAMWRRTEAGWRLRSELFVTLTCSGSGYCQR